MNEPQVWTMVIGTIAVFFTLTGLVTTWFTRLIRAEFAVVNARIDGVETTVDARFDVVGARFDAVDTKLAHLDRDVHALTTQVFHRPE